MKVRNRFAGFLVPALAVIASAGGIALADGVKVGGAIDKPSEWSADQLKREFGSEIKPIQYASHGQQHTANCVPLLSLLKKCGVPTELKKDPNAQPADKNRPLRFAVVVRGRDGYTATFSLPELLPEIGNKEAWIAFDVDGQPLPEKETPVNLVVPSDSKPGRWVHGVGSITIIDGSTATTQPNR